MRAYQCLYSEYAAFSRLVLAWQHHMLHELILSMWHFSPFF